MEDSLDVTEDTAASTEVAAPAAPAAPADDTATGTAEVTATTTDDEVDENYDPVEAAVQARLALESERMATAAEATARTRFEAEQRATEQRRTIEVAQNQLRDALADTIKTARSGLKGITVYDDKGQAATLSDDAIEQLVVKPIQSYNATVQQNVQNRIFNDLARTALDTLPEAQRPVFTEKASGKPLDEWLRTYAETQATDTEQYKALQREIDVKTTAAEARGFARGQKAPAGSAPRGGTERAPAATSTNVDMSTHVGLATALSNGAITEAEYLDRRRKLQ